MICFFDGLTTQRTALTVGPTFDKRNHSCHLHCSPVYPIFTMLLCWFFCWIPTTNNVIFWFMFCCFAFLCCVFERLWSHVQDGVAVRGGRAGLTCPTQGAAQLPSRPEDTLQARTLGTVQRFCKTVNSFLVSGWQERDLGRETDRTEE